MSHNVKYGTYPENVNRKKVETDWDNYVACEDWQEGASGLPCPIRWIEKEILNSYDDARLYLAEHDNGDYDQLAVRYREIKINPTKKHITLRNKLNNLQAEYLQRNSVIYATTVKSEYVGCKGCGSKLASKYIQNTNKCPLCHAELRSATTLTGLQRLKERIGVAEKLLKNEENTIRKKEEKRAVIKWLVKVEYHT